MRLEIRGEYPPDWKAIALSVRQEAGWRCVRCCHAFSLDGHPLLCDDRCDPRRCRARGIAARGGRHNYGVHHLDGDKANCRWWNLLALCNSCHLSIQSRVIPGRPWIVDHSPWFKPYAAGFYSWYYGQLELARAEVEADIPKYLAMGQPWLAEAPV